MKITKTAPALLLVALAVVSTGCGGGGGGGGSSSASGGGSLVGTWEYVDRQSASSLVTGSSSYTTKTTTFHADGRYQYSSTFIFNSANTPNNTITDFGTWTFDGSTLAYTSGQTGKSAKLPTQVDPSGSAIYVNGVMWIRK